MNVMIFFDLKKCEFFEKNKLLPVLGFTFCFFLLVGEFLAYQQEKTERETEHRK